MKRICRTAAACGMMYLCHRMAKKNMILFSGQNEPIQNIGGVLSTFRSQGLEPLLSGFFDNSAFSPRLTVLANRDTLTPVEAENLGLLLRNYSFELITVDPKALQHTLADSSLTTENKLAISRYIRDLYSGSIVIKNQAGDIRTIDLNSDSGPRSLATFVRPPLVVDSFSPEAIQNLTKSLQENDVAKRNYRSQRSGDDRGQLQRAGLLLQVGQSVVHDHQG